jgi:hypothetical protein
MAIKTEKLKNWIAGVSNVAADNSLPKDQYGKTIGLRDGVNVDILTSGKLRRRPGIRQVVADAGAHSAYASDNMLIWATASTLKTRGIDNVVRTALTDIRLSKPLSFVTLNGRTYFSNEKINGIINADGSYEPWGITPPANPPTLSAVAGVYQYQVTCTFVTVSGEESGAPIAAKVLCGDTPTIRVYNIPQSSDGRVVATRLYVTNIDGQLFSHATDVPAGQTIAVLSGFFSNGAALKTQFMQPPPPGQLLEYNNGIIYIASGSNIAMTRPLQYGLHDPAEDFFMYSERVTLLRGVPDGLYLSADQIYYLPKAGTDDVTQVQTMTGKAIEGAVCSLPNSEDIMFVTDRGFYQATLQGQIKNLTEAQVALDFYPRGAMGFIERNGHKAIVAIFDEGSLNPAVSEDFRVNDAARKAARS